MPDQPDNSSMRLAQCRASCAGRTSLMSGEKLSNISLHKPLLSLTVEPHLLLSSSKLSDKFGLSHMPATHYAHHTSTPTQLNRSVDARFQVIGFNIYKVKWLISASKQALYIIVMCETYCLLNTCWHKLFLNLLCTACTHSLMVTSCSRRRSKS